MTDETIAPIDEVAADLMRNVAEFKASGPDLSPEQVREGARVMGRHCRQIVTARTHADQRVRDAWAVVERYDLYPAEVVDLGLRDPLETRGNRPKDDDWAVELVADLVFGRNGETGTGRGQAYAEAARRLKEATGSPTSQANIAKRISRKFLLAERRGAFASL